jgi:hypothetical protein
MKKIIFLLCIAFGISTFAQIDRDQLSLDISKTDAANTEKLKAFIWKEDLVVTVDGEEKLTVVNEISLDEEGKVHVTNIDSDTKVKQQRGIRGRIQANVAEDNLDYVDKAMDLALQYSFMTKGQLIDFFGKAELTDKDGIITATAGNIFVKGDKVTLKVESDTKLFVSKEFSSFVGEDPMSGKIVYDKFSNGIDHAKSYTLNLPGKKAVIKATNRDYVMKMQ